MIQFQNILADKAVRRQYYKHPPLVDAPPPPEMWAAVTPEYTKHRKGAKAEAQGTEASPIDPTGSLEDTQRRHRSHEYIELAGMISKLLSRRGKR